VLSAELQEAKGRASMNLGEVSVLRAKNNECERAKDALLTEKYKDFFDQVIYPPVGNKLTTLKLEFHFAHKIITSEEKFDNVRNYINTLNEFPKFQGGEKVSSIYTDASKEKFGIYIVRFEKGSWEEFTISGIFNATDKQLDINIKEYFALLIGILIASYLDSLRIIHLHYILYCDNEASRLLASTKRLI